MQVILCLIFITAEWMINETRVTIIFWLFVCCWLCFCFFLTMDRLDRMDKMQKCGYVESHTSHAFVGLVKEGCQNLVKEGRQTAGNQV